MALEAATKVSELNSANPIGSSTPVSELDDHIRLVKALLKLLGRQVDAEVVTHTGTTPTLIVGSLNICTNVAAVTATVPAAMAAGECFSVLFTNGLTTNVLNRNGQNIGGLAENMNVNADTSNLVLTLRASGTSKGLVLQ